MLLKEADIENSIHIDFVPMVDVLFNLLIFFLLATTIAQVEREVNVTLPFAGAATPISSALRELIVNVDAEGHIVVNGRNTTAEAFGAMVKDLVAANPQQKVSVRGDRRTAYANVVQVLDACKANGIQEPYLDTILEK
jgi:biopolymer transport protein ExbD